MDKGYFPRVTKQSPMRLWINNEDPDLIIKEALQDRKTGENFIAKVPATKAGLKTVESLIGENVPVLVTEIMGVAQAVHSFCVDTLGGKKLKIFSKTSTVKWFCIQNILTFILMLLYYNHINVQNQSD